MPSLEGPSIDYEGGRDPEGDETPEVDPLDEAEETPSEELEDGQFDEPGHPDQEEEPDHPVEADGPKSMVNGEPLTEISGLGNGNGLTNGNGMSNGNGFVNGSGFTNGGGFTNGNGMTNGAGMTNGNGMTNGAGLTNGNGMTNGAGLTNGNGMTNGAGMTNGSGLTNGSSIPPDHSGKGDWSLLRGSSSGKGPRLPGRHLARQQMRRRVAVAFLFLALLAIPLLLSFAGLLGPEEDRIKIDGMFSDWDGVMEYSDGSGDAGGAVFIDMLSWRMYRSDEFLAVRASFSGDFKGFSHQGEVGDVHLFVFIDNDEDVTTGYRIGGLGSDLMVKVAGTSEGAFSGSVLRWDTSHRVEAGRTRSSDDWNGWAGASGSVEVAVRGKELELKASPETQVQQDALVLLCAVDAFGRHDLGDVFADGVQPTLTVTQTPIGPDTLTASRTEVLRLVLKAYGGDVTVVKTSFDGWWADIHDPVDTPFLVERGADATKTVSIAADIEKVGQAVGVGTADWDAGEAHVVVRGDMYMGYAIRPPDTIVLDGAFGDWDLSGASAAEDARRDVTVHPQAPPEVSVPDLALVAAERNDDSLALYAQVVDGMLAGARVPLMPTTIPQGALDIDGDGRFDLDGDGTEEGFGTRDDDWDNDHGQPDDPDTPFADTGTDEVDEDDDNDGVPDWNDPSRGGPHVPGPPSALPSLEGMDAVEFLVDSDGDTTTGYSPDGYLLGADHRVLVKGREGLVRGSDLFAFSGSGATEWVWERLGDADHGMDGTRLEVGLPLNVIASPGNATVIVRATGWTGSKDWSDNLLEGDLSIGGGLDAGRSVGAIDPYALTESGGFSISPTGETWTPKDGPADAGAVVDVAAGDGTQAGYVYTVTSQGKVMVSTSATTGWTEYGQGTPGLPASSAYVGIALGKGSLVGYVYVLRNDGSVYVCERATGGWTKYGQGTPVIPTSTAHVDIASGGEGLEGYVYILRADGRVYVSTSAVRGWTQYGQGNPVLPSTDPDYRAIGTGDGTTRGSIYVMSGSGAVFVATSATTGWTRYAPGTPALPSSEGFVAMDAGTDRQPGRVVVMGRDGGAYVADSAVGGWTKYGQGSPALPSGMGYTGLTLGASRLPGYVYLVAEDGKAYVCDNAVRGWVRYGQGTPTLPVVGGHSAVAGVDTDIWMLALNGTVHRSSNGGDSWSLFGTVGAHDDGWVSITVGSDGGLYVLRRDGTVRTSATGASSWSGHGDAGTGTSWRAVSSDDGDYLYALRSDGVAAYATTSSSTWISKGDAGDGTCWVSLTAFDDSGHVYALRSDRAISRATAGTSSAWSTWATADSDYSWVATATNGTHVYALRNDGRVDRATVAVTPTWSISYGDTGGDTAWSDIAVPIPEFPSLIVQALITLALVQAVRMRASTSRSNNDPHETANEPEGVET